MPYACPPFVPFLFVAAAIAICLGLLLRQHLHIRREQDLGFDHQSGQLLLIMLVVALLSTGLFLGYVLIPQAGC